MLLPGLESWSKAWAKSSAKQSVGGWEHVSDVLLFHSQLVILCIFVPSELAIFKAAAIVLS